MQELFSHSKNNVFLITDMKCSTIWAAMKKMKSVPAKGSTDILGFMASALLCSEDCAG